MKTLTRIFPLGLLLMVLPAASGQQLYRSDNGGAYRSRDNVDQYRDDRPWWAGPPARPEPYQQRSYRPDYGASGYGARSESRQGMKPVHRFVHPESGSLVFSTQPEQEEQFTLHRHYVYEGVAFNVLSHNAPGTVPLHRFYAYGTRHFYGTSADLAERNGGWFEQTLGYIYAQSQSNTMPLHAWFDGSSQSYHYSTRRVNVPPHHEYLGVVGYVLRP